MDYHDSCPKLPAAASAGEAIVWLRSATKCLGPGFHLDTPASDYIRGDDDSPTFTPLQADRFDNDLARSFELLAAEGRDPYAVAFKVQRRLLGMPLP